MTTRTAVPLQFVRSFKEVVKQTVGDTCEGTVKDNRAADDEYFSADSGDIALCTEFQSGSTDGISEACYRYKGTCARVFRDLLVKSQPREQRRDKYQRNGNRSSACFFVQPAPATKSSFRRA